MSESGEKPERAISYSDASPFVRLFKTESRVRIVDILLRKHYKPLTTKEIADHAGIDRSSVTRNLGELIEIDVVVEVDSVANAKRYQINKNNPVTKALGQAHDELFSLGDRISVTGGRDGDREKESDGTGTFHESEAVQMPGEPFDLEEVLALLDSDDEKIRTVAAEALIELSAERPGEFAGSLSSIEEVLSRRPELHEPVAEMVRNISRRQPGLISKSLFSTLLDLGLEEPTKSAEVADTRLDEGTDGQ